MLIFIGIIGLGIILWPLISGAIASLFNGIVYIASGFIYWIIRFIKHPKNREENDKIISIATAIAFITVIAAIFIVIII